MERDTKKNYRVFKFVSRCCDVFTLTLLLFCIATFLTFPATAGFYDEPAKVRTTPEEWLPLALEGDARSQLNLGWAYENGKGVDQDLTEAAKWYANAALGGLPRAVRLYAKALEEGRGIKVDLKVAKLWYESINDHESVARVIGKLRKAGLSVIDNRASNDAVKELQLPRASKSVNYFNTEVVKKVQRALVKLRYQGVTVDGVLGPKSLGALDQLVRKNNLELPKPLTNQILSSALNSLNDDIGKKTNVVKSSSTYMKHIGSNRSPSNYSRVKDVDTGYDRAIPERATQVKTYRGGDGDQRQFNDGLVAFFALIAIFIVIGVMKRALSKVDANGVIAKERANKFKLPELLDSSFEQSAEDQFGQKESRTFVKDKGEADRTKGFFGFFKSVNDDARGAILKKGLEDTMAILDEGSVIQNAMIMENCVMRMQKLKATGKYELMTSNDFVALGKELQKKAGKAYDAAWIQATAIWMVGAFLESKAGRSKDARQVHKVLDNLIREYE